MDGMTSNEGVMEGYSTPKPILHGCEEEAEEQQNVQQWECFNWAIPTVLGENGERDGDRETLEINDVSSTLSPFIQNSIHPSVSPLLPPPHSGLAASVDIEFNYWFPSHYTSESKINLIYNNYNFYEIPIWCLIIVFLYQHIITKKCKHFD